MEGMTRGHAGTHAQHLIEPSERHGCQYRDRDLVRDYSFYCDCAQDGGRAHDLTCLSNLGHNFKQNCIFNLSM